MLGRVDSALGLLGDGVGSGDAIPVIGGFERRSCS
jgi:hypothetical protein